MKNTLVLIFIFSLFFFSTCKKDDSTPDNNNNNNPPADTTAHVYQIIYWAEVESSSSFATNYNVNYFINGTEYIDQCDSCPAHLRWVERDFSTSDKTKQLKISITPRGCGWETNESKHFYLRIFVDGEVKADLTQEHIILPHPIDTVNPVYSLTYNL